jgi:protein SCO1/2
MKIVLLALGLMFCSMGFPLFAETLPLPYMKASDFTPFWKSTLTEKDPIPAAVDAFRLKNQANQVLTEKSMKGHISLVNFFFTSCGSVCPRLMNQVQKVQKKLIGVSGVRIYSISVTPDEDSPRQLADYAKSRTMDLKNWDLITGDRAEIYRLGRNVFRADRTPDGTISNSEFIHTQAIYLLDSEMRIRGVYQSDKVTDMALLVQDAAKLSQK